MRLRFFPPSQTGTDPRIGFRLGDIGTHTSRTMMFEELEAVLAAVPPAGKRADYTEAIIESNCLRKPTIATRRLTSQRLSELYSLDPEVPIFRILRRLWDLDPASHPQLALLCSIARDPLLAATASAVLPLGEGAELPRSAMRDALREVVGERLNDSTLDKVLRNTASSWSQAGHLQGRTFKVRRAVKPTPVAVAFAFYLANAAGFHGEDILKSAWVKVLDCSASSALELGLEAKRIGLLDLRVAGEVFDLNLDRMDPEGPRR